MLKKYEYHSSKLTILDRAMNHLYTFITNRVPEWLAPNIITLTSMFLTLIGVG